MSDKKDWTIMIYMAGDNNLSGDMAYALADFKKIWGKVDEMDKEVKQNSNLLVYFDSASLTVPTRYYDFTEKRHEPVDAYQFAEQLNAKEKTTAEKVKINKSENSAAPESIINFVRWCIEEQKRTAKNYALIFSSHSFGFQGSSFLIDNSSGDYMSLPELTYTLGEIKKNILQNNKLSILGFDSCVMSTLEVGYELREFAEILLASEGSIPNAGWSYASILNDFAPNSDSNGSIPKWFGRSRPTNSLKVTRNSSSENVEPYSHKTATNIVKSLRLSQSEVAESGNSTDISAWDLSKTDSVRDAVNELGQELFKHINFLGLNTFNEIFELEDIEEIQKSEEEMFVFERLKRAIIYSHYECQTYMNEQNVDLVDFCSNLFTECDLIEKQMKSLNANCDITVFSSIKEKCAAIIKCVDKVVIANGFVGDQYQYSNGISIYFPWTAITFALTFNKYNNLRFTSTASKQEFDDGWSNFVLFFSCIYSIRHLRDYEPADSYLKFLQTYIGKKLQEVTNKPILSPDDVNNNGTKDAGTTLNKGEFYEYLRYFGRFKNFVPDWEITDVFEAKNYDEDYLYTDSLEYDFQGLDPVSRDNQEDD